MVASLLVDRGHPLAEHRHHVVADPGPDHVDEAGDQRQPLALVMDLPQVGHVGDAGLAREVRDLPGRTPSSHSPVGPSASMSASRSSRSLNLPSDADFATSFSRSNPLRRVTGSTTYSLPSRSRATGPTRPANRLVDGGVYLGPDRRGHRVQRGVPGQLAPRPHQLLERDVDQVSRVVLGLRRLPDSPLGNLPHPDRVVGDLHPRADEFPVPFSGSLRRRRTPPPGPAPGSRARAGPPPTARHPTWGNNPAAGTTSAAPRAPAGAPGLGPASRPHSVSASVGVKASASSRPGTTRPNRGYAVRSTEVMANPRESRQLDDAQHNEPHLTYAARFCRIPAGQAGGGQGAPSPRREPCQDRQGPRRQPRLDLPAPAR